MDELHTIFHVRLHYLFKLQKNNTDIYDYSFNFHVILCV
jgi:hypothetical protein